MYEKILVPLDGSDVAEAVLPHVEPIATKFGSEVILLQVVPTFAEILGDTLPRSSFPAVDAGVSVDIAEQQHESTQESAQTYLEAKRTELASRGINAGIDLREGPAPAAVILAVALDTGCDLVAMSTHGRSGIGRALMGSVADEVVRNSALPVLLVRARG
jgi:nucleotide-binding universal stress UspA family protein